MTSPRNRRGVVAVSCLLVVLVITVVALALLARRGSRERPEADRSAATRTVTVFRDGEPSPSVTPTVLRVELISGAPKEGNATVLTDEDCTPDDAGISHCRNSLRLENGSEIVVRHPHDMMQIPCLEPGEPVLLVAA